MEQASAKQKAKKAPKSSGRLNPAVQEFQLRQSFSKQSSSDLFRSCLIITDLIFNHSLQNTAPIVRSETSLIPNVAGDPLKTKHATERNVEADKGHEERGTPPTHDINEHLQDLWAMPAKLEETLGTMQIACSDMLAWTSVVTRALASEGDGTDCEEAFKKFKKAWEKQKALAGELRMHLRCANDRLAIDSVGDEERDLIGPEGMGGDLPKLKSKVAFESLM